MNSMNTTLVLLAGLLGMASAGRAMPVPGDIVINEIMQNPAAVPDRHGEWFELFNATTAPIDIDGWTLRDDGGDEHTIHHGGPFLIPAFSYRVLGRNANPSRNGGVAVDYQYRGLALANGSDELVLLDGLLEIDRVAWDNGARFPDPSGASMELIHPGFDNAVGANWRAATTAFGQGDFASPGAANSNFQARSVAEPWPIVLLGFTALIHPRRRRPSSYRGSTGSALIDR